MAEYSGGLVATGVGTALRPVFAVLSTATITCMLREVKVYNPTATACIYELVRFTGGTAGGDVTEVKQRTDCPAANILFKGLWTADATIVEKTGDIFYLPPGACEIATWGEGGLESAIGATAGIGVVLHSGTGQLIGVKFKVTE